MSGIFRALVDVSAPKKIEQNNKNISLRFKVFRIFHLLNEGTISRQQVLSKSGRILQKFTQHYNSGEIQQTEVISFPILITFTLVGLT